MPETGTMGEAERRAKLAAAAARTMTAISEALDRMLARVGDDPPKGVDAKELGSLVTAWQKAMQTVLEVESRRDRDTEKSAGDGAGEIDFVGARREILGKLARLAGEG